MSIIRSRGCRAGAWVFDDVTAGGVAEDPRRGRPGALEPGIVLPATVHLLFRLVEQAQFELLFSGRHETCGGRAGGRGIGQQSVKRVEEGGVAAR